MRGKGCKRTPTTLFSIFAALVAAFVFSGPAALAAVDPGTSTPAISSDQADYAPGSLVTLSGSNWAPGETVHIDVNDDQGKTWERGVYVTADATGAITDQFNLPDWFVATYAVNATGPISGTATATFTDGNVKYDIAPSGQTTQFVETLYEAANCAPPIKNGYPNTANGSSGGSVGVGSSQSLRLDAAPSSVGGGAFQAWSGPAATFTVIAGTSGRSICVAGFQNGNRNYVATYASPRAQAGPDDHVQPACDPGRLQLDVPCQRDRDLGPDGQHRRFRRLHVVVRHGHDDERHGHLHAGRVAGR